MLQFLNLTRRGCVRSLIGSHSSSTAATFIKHPVEKNEPPIERKNENFQKNTMVAAAFASLNEDENAHDHVSKLEKKSTNSEILKSFSNQNVADQIKNANSVNDLLAITENIPVSRQHALRVISTLAEWTTKNKTKLNEFESDPRFLKLCRIIGRNRSTSAQGEKKSLSYTRDDLNTLLEVTGDDEAAKLITTISLPQMIKVMSTLAQQKRRSKPLLQSLAYNITRNSGHLDLKQCGDLLYSIAILNYPDNVLLNRVCTDMQIRLNTNKDKSAVVGSILTSFGLLKYKDTDALESLSDWVLQHHDKCRAKDIAVLIVTLAVLNHRPINSDKLFEVLLPQLAFEDHTNPTDWLNIVWSLVCLDRCPIDKVNHVLSTDFINSLILKEDLSFSSKMKILNIKAASELLMTSEHKLKQEVDFSVCSFQRKYSSQKQTMVNSVLDALKSLFPSENYLRTMINTNMGFIQDAECFVDSNCNPLPVDSTDKSGTRIAIQVLDYHDMCQNVCEPHGSVALSARLLEAQGYKILSIPYTEYQPSDKLVKRVQYIESKFKQIVSSVKQQ